MPPTVFGEYSVTLHDISTQVAKRSIKGLISNYLPNVGIKINFGLPLVKNGKEVYRVYIKFDSLKTVDELMKNRTSLRLHGEPVCATRTLPKSCLLYDQNVTGLKINTYQSAADHTPMAKLNVAILEKHFQHFGKIRYCEWTNADQTEALFAFEDYDSVDRIILCHPSSEIKGLKVNLEKTWTKEDYSTDEHPYVIHVTNLPLRVTSEEVSTLFGVPIAVILLYPCFRIEQTYLVDGRSSSEAWIKNFKDEKTAQVLAEKKTGTFLRTNKIQCEAMLEPIDDESELCERFQQGQCTYTMDACHYKHFSCLEPDTCDNINCWYGHSMQRKTKSIKRPNHRSENAQYRVKFSNLPSNITMESLMARFKIDPKSSHHLILQPTEENPDSPRMAYLIRQPLENKLRQQIDRWHNTSFSPLSLRKIQCQLELNQDHFDWSDSADIIRPLHNGRCVSPVPSMQSVRSDRPNPTPYYSSAASTTSCSPSLLKKPHPVGKLQVPKLVPTLSSIAPQQKSTTTNNLKSKSVSAIRQPPSDFSSLSAQWRWSSQMIPGDPWDRDELYWVESQSNKEKNVVIKIYLPKNDQTARARGQRERLALEKLNKLNCVPKFFNSNVDTSNDDQSKKELWTVMKLSNGERLSDYVKGNKLHLSDALQITRRLLHIIQQIHARNVIHRDIQPKNILVGPRSNSQEINFMLINFTSAWINDNQSTHSMDNLDDQLGNSFYRMPQFEVRETETELNEDNDQLKQFRRSATIDTTGICAILFWIITGHEPKESQDIWGTTPHRLRDNLKIIESKILALTAFRMEMRIHEHLMRHLMLIFDRCFGGPNQQWPVDELDYQLQFMLALIEDEKEHNSYFPSSAQNTADSTSSPSLLLGDPFVYAVSLIHHLKNQFVVRYSNCIRWSTEETNRWCSRDGRIEHYHLMIFSDQTKNLSVDIHWNVRILKEQQFSIGIKAKDHKKINIELPLGLWKINNQTNDFDVHMKTFETEMKILIYLLCQSVGF